MTRRVFLPAVAAACAAGRTAAAAGQAPLTVPVQVILDGRARPRPERSRGFRNRIWPEAVRDFSYCGIRLESTERKGDVGRSPGDRPIFTGLDRDAINLIVTDQIPIHWDRARGLAGVAARIDGRDVCMVALNHAHSHQIPFFSVNTVTHELLHILLDDTREGRPEGWRGHQREGRINWYATRMWLFHDGGAVRAGARAWLARRVSK